MKKLSLVITAVCLSIGVYAQTDTTGTATQRGTNNTNMGTGTQRDMNNSKMPVQPQENTTTGTKSPSMVKQHPDGYMMKSGKVVMIKDGKVTTLDKEVTLENGTTITTNGSILQMDGTKATLKEGEHVDMTGKMVPMQEQPK